jgi:hypothetical protein
VYYQQFLSSCSEGDFQEGSLGPGGGLSRWVLVLLVAPAVKCVASCSVLHTSVFLLGGGGGLSAQAMLPSFLRTPLAYE